MTSEAAFLFAMVLDKKNSGTFISWKETINWHPSDGILWIHLNCGIEQSYRQFLLDSALDSFIIDSLSATKTRPRCYTHNDGVTLILRGVNLNPGADPEDMISVRIWAEKNKIITSSFSNLISIDDIKKSLSEKNGPATSGEFLSVLAENLSFHISNVLEKLDDRIDDLEDRTFKSHDRKMQGNISDLLRQTIKFIRHLTPQYEALYALQNIKLDWFEENNHFSLREIVNSTTRYLEGLTVAKNHVEIAQEELRVCFSQQLNKTMYLLAVITSIFLPLSLLTGLLGINVAGIPGANHPLAFIIVCSMLGLIAIIQVLILKKIHWL